MEYRVLFKVATLNLGELSVVLRPEPAIFRPGFRLSALLSVADEEATTAVEKQSETKASPSNLKQRSGKNKRR